MFSFRDFYIFDSFSSVISESQSMERGSPHLACFFPAECQSLRNLLRDVALNIAFRLAVDYSRLFRISHHVTACGEAYDSNGVGFADSRFEGVSPINGAPDVDLCYFLDDLGFFLNQS